MSKPVILAAIVILIVVFVGGFWWMNSANKNSSMTPQTSTTPEMTTTPSAMTPEATNSTSEAEMSAGTKEFTVEGSNFKFSPTTLTVKKGDKVKITFKNTGGTHDWVLDGYNVKGKVIQGGQEEVVEFTADKTGTFEYYCSVGNHRQMGMKGSLVVQ